MLFAHIVRSMTHSANRDEVDIWCTGICCMYCATYMTNHAERNRQITAKKQYHNSSKLQKHVCDVNRILARVHLSTTSHVAHIRNTPMIVKLLPSIHPSVHTASAHRRFISASTIKRCLQQHIDWYMWTCILAHPNRLVSRRCKLARNRFSGFCNQVSINPFLRVHPPIH